MSDALDVAIVTKVLNLAPLYCRSWSRIPAKNKNPAKDLHWSEHRLLLADDLVVTIGEFCSTYRRPPTWCVAQKHAAHIMMSLPTFTHQQDSVPAVHVDLPSDLTAVGHFSYGRGKKLSVYIRDGKYPAVFVGDDSQACMLNIDGGLPLLVVQLELAGVCNLRCPYCTWHKRTVGKQMMDTVMAKRLVDEAVEMGVGLIRFHQLGESLLHPDLLDLLTYAEGLGVEYELATNCTLLEGEIAYVLRQLRGLRLHFTIHWSMGPKLLEAAKRNILNYLLHSFANREVTVTMIMHEDARDRYDEFIDTFLPAMETCPSNATLHLKQPLTWPNDEPNRGFIVTDLADHPKVILGENPTPVSTGLGCMMPEFFLGILADGTAVPCCVNAEEHDTWGLPHASNSSLRDIWEGIKMEAVRRLKLEKSDMVPCGHCLKRTDCIWETK